MTSFEFVFGLLSVVTSLALTRMLGSGVALLRRARDVRFSWPHGLWAATAFMVLVANWAALWSMRDVQAWGALDVLIRLVFVCVLYAFCDLVMPDERDASASLDLREFHAREGARYKWAHMMFSVLALLVIAHAVPDVGRWLEAGKFAICAAVITAVSLRARSTWLDGATSVALALLAGAFLASRLQVFSA